MSGIWGAGGDGYGSAPNGTLPYATEPRRPNGQVPRPGQSRSRPPQSPPVQSRRAQPPKAQEDSSMWSWMFGADDDAEPKATPSTSRRARTRGGSDGRKWSKESVDSMDTTIGKGFAAQLKRGVKTAESQAKDGPKRAQMVPQKDGGFVATIQRGFEGLFGHFARSKEEVLKMRGPMRASEYEAVPGDDIDQKVQYLARWLPPKLGSDLMIYRRSFGQYEIGGEEVELKWHSWIRPDGVPMKDVFVFMPEVDEDDGKPNFEPLPIYLQHSAGVAHNLKNGHAVTQVPHERRLSFPDAQATSLMDADADKRFNAMAVAAEQARLREEAAKGWRKESEDIRQPASEDLNAQVANERSRRGSESDPSSRSEPSSENVRTSRRQSQQDRGVALPAVPEYGVQSRDLSPPPMEMPRRSRGDQSPPPLQSHTPWRSQSPPPLQQGHPSRQDLSPPPGYLQHANVQPGLQLRAQSPPPPPAPPSRPMIHRQPSGPLPTASMWPPPAAPTPGVVVRQPPLAPMMGSFGPQNMQGSFGSAATPAPMMGSFGPQGIHGALAAAPPPFSSKVSMPGPLLQGPAIGSGTFYSSGSTFYAQPGSGTFYGVAPPVAYVR